MRCVIFLLVLACLPLCVEARKKNGFDVGNAAIPIREIKAGGPPRDGIPALNNPSFVQSSQVDFLSEDDRIIGVRFKNTARAYPIRILNWHEIVNDRIDDQYFAVTYCPLCGSGMVFGTNVGSSVEDGALIFGVSGLLYNSDMLLYDRNSESLWSQIMAEAISGPLLDTELPQLPALHTTWREWRAQYPETTVLDIETGFARDYKRSPYAGYEKNRRLFFKVSNRAPKTYHPKALVLGVSRNDVHKAYPLAELVGSGSMTDHVGGETIQVSWNTTDQSAYVVDGAGNLLPSTMLYWFAWYAFHPETEVFVAKKDE